MKRLMPKTLFMRLTVLWCLLTVFAQVALGLFFLSGWHRQFSHWPVIVFVAQFVAALALTWLAARHATRPLRALADASEAFGGDQPFATIPEAGPSEVLRAAAAFNRMGKRIEQHLSERVRILAAISHDLQTPITRLRLRAELLDDAAARGKWLADLDAMESLVDEGLAYARSKDRSSETACLVDIYALLDNIACDYADAGRQVTLSAREGLRATTRPRALRRLLGNVIDNALKYAGTAEVSATADETSLCIRVSDRGPGIQEDQLEAVFEPFFRLEASRNRDSGGTGLGLSIARELCATLGGTLVLANRAGGGLEARLVLPLL